MKLDPTKEAIIEVWLVPRSLYEVWSVLQKAAMAGGWCTASRRVSGISPNFQHVVGMDGGQHVSSPPGVPTVALASPWSDSLTMFASLPM